MLTAVVMAKAPVPGRVKTRLTTRLSAEQAAAVHEAMLDCVLARLEGHLPGRRVLAVADLEAHRAWAEATIAARPLPWRLVDQGSGDLGQRLCRAWQTVSADGPAAFFGVDSPDAPAEALRAIAPAAGEGLAVGPTSDGGYWTLAGGYAPSVLSGIDWGTPAVYDQTLGAARRAGLSVHPLPAWQDVDDPDDLRDLRRRLRDPNEPPLRRLADRLRRICGDEP